MKDGPGNARCMEICCTGPDRLMKSETGLMMPVHFVSKEA